MKNRFHYAWVIFFAACLISLVGFGLLINTVGLYFSPISESFNVGIGDVSFMSTCQNLACAITLLFAGKIMDKLNYRVILTICWAIIGGGLISLGFAESLTHLYIVWTLIGICQPFAIVLSIPVLLGNWFVEKYGTVLGIAMALSAVGGTIFNPLISSIIGNVGWQQAYMVEGGIIAVLLIPVALFIVRYKPSNGWKPYGYNVHTDEIEENETDTGITLNQALRSYKFYGLAFAYVALQWVAGLVQHISSHIVNTGQSLTVGASVVSGVMIGATLGKLVIGYLLDKLDNKLVVLLFAMIGAFGWGGLLFTTNMFLVIAMGLFLGIGQGLLLVGLPYFIRKIFGTKDYSNILSVTSMAGSVAAALSVGVDGKFFDLTGSYNSPLTLNVVLYAIAAVTIITAIVTKKNNATPLVESKEQSN